MILTVGIVLYNEENNLNLLRENLELLSEYRGKICVIVVDNNSTDGTSAALDELAINDEFLLVRRDINHLGQARADVVRLAETSWVAFFDGDCRIPSEWLPAFWDIKAGLPKNTAAVGGPLEPCGKNESLFLALFASILGHFNSTQAKNFDSLTAVDHLPTANVFYRRQLLMGVGSFQDEYPYVGEDLDLSYRLRGMGYSLIVYPDLKIKHKAPSSLKVWFFKVFNYGFARALVGYKYGDLISVRYILPLAFQIILLSSLVMINVYSIVLWCIYLIVTLVVSLFYMRKVNPFKLWLYLMVTHVSYGAGMTLGLVAAIFGYKNKRLALQKNKVSPKEDRL